MLSLSILVRYDSITFCLRQYTMQKVQDDRSLSIFFWPWSYTMVEFSGGGYTMWRSQVVVDLDSGRVN